MAQLAPTLIAQQQEQLEILELLAEMRVEPAPTPVVQDIELIFDGLVQGVMSANVGNLFVAGRPTSIASEPTTLLTRSNIEALVR